MNVLVGAYQGGQLVHKVLPQRWKQVAAWLKPLPTALNKDECVKVANYPSHLGLTLLARR
jgi:hypothetical protein